MSPNRAAGMVPHFLAAVSQPRPEGPSPGAARKGKARAWGVALALLSACAPLPAQEAPLPARPEQLGPRTALRFTPPPLVKKTLPNGLRLVLLEDHTLPLVHLKALVKAGSIYDPPQKVGLAELAGASLAAAGTRAHDADTLHQILESIAADLTSAGEAEETSVSMDLLSKDLERGLPLFAEVLLVPAFEAGKVEVERGKMLESLKRQNEDPFSAAHREFNKRLYGAQSPWARTPSMEGLRSITASDLAPFHRRYFKPGSTVLAASGDFDAQALARRLGDLFGKWAPGVPDYPAVVPAPEESPVGVRIVDKPDLTQTSLFVGELAGKRFQGNALNLDRYPMEVMNTVLGGGGFNSTLMREIRSNRGLAYGAGSFYTFGTDRGTFAAYCQTGVDTTAQVVGLVGEIFQRVTSAQPSQQELDLARESLLNQFVFKYDTPQGVVDQAALLELRGFPPDFLGTYCDRIGKVTARDAQEIARKYIHPGRQTVLILGPAKSLKDALKEFGEVEVVPLPEP